MYRVRAIGSSSDCTLLRNVGTRNVAEELMWRISATMWSGVLSETRSTDFGGRYIDITNLLELERTFRRSDVEDVAHLRCRVHTATRVRKNFRKYALSCYLFPRARNSVYNMLRRNIVAPWDIKKNIRTHHILHIITFPKDLAKVSDVIICILLRFTCTLCIRYLKKKR